MELKDKAPVFEDFGELFEQAIREEKAEGSVVTGIVTNVTDVDVSVDVGLKSEDRILIKEFADDAGNTNVSVGDEVEVFIERLEGRNGNPSLSREKALREKAWYKFEDLHKQNVVVDGKIIGRVKGGFAVDLGRIIAFLPGSQVDIRPIKDISFLLDSTQQFRILKMDRAQGNVVVSRRAILEESRAEARDALLSNISEGSVLEGIVKNITDYGAFVDLGSVDGLLHITDISWNKISHPSEVLSLGQQVKVMVIKYNEETKRVSLGVKQLEQNPWDGFADKYPAGIELDGVVTTITDYGAFVRLASGVEGLVYHTEISWNNKNIHPKKLLKIGDEVKVKVLEIDIAKHKMSLSIKQCKPNPWVMFADEHPVNSVVEGVIQNIADFGMFVMIGQENDPKAIEALVPGSEISWELKQEEALAKYSKGDVVQGMVLSIDPERERVTLGIKQLSQDSAGAALQNLKEGMDITCTVVAIKRDGIEVEISEGLRSFIKKGDLSKHKTEQKPERFGQGDKIDARVVSVDPKERKVVLSVKVLEMEVEKRVIEEYGSKSSGASLGDILGMALNKENEDK